VKRRIRGVTGKEFRLMNNQPTAALAHPEWCAKEHNEGYPVHMAEIGAEDLPLNVERSLAVAVVQTGDDARTAKIWLCEHGAMTTAVTELAPNTALELGERLIAAVDLLDGIKVGDRPR
jgi:hypothetical protein